ncbi:receptor-type tyrosine-protein phosphatase epsilon-like [Watersipora subatra]|uniref:receptor-type tyrosine-protein phosphatase epsilon-like n=1 Tax=Watersipora subatra TaxID=2589382 RepID=UPI00355BDFE8
MVTRFILEVRGQIPPLPPVSSVPYIPQTLGSTETCQHFKIVLLASNHKARYVMRTLKLYKNREARIVKQFEFQFSGDLSSPAEMSLFIDLARKVRTLHADDDCPLLVHCSQEAKIGLYIGLSVLLEEASSQECVNVAKCVEKIRKRRPQLIKTEREYRVLYETLNEALKSEAYVCKRESLKTKLETKMDIIAEEYQRIQKLLMKAESNEGGLRTKDSLTHGLTGPDGFHILDSYKRAGQFIIGSALKEHQVEAFWKMIWPEDIKVIAMLGSQTTGCIPDADTKTITVGEILVERTSSESNELVQVVELKVNGRSVNLMIVNNWADGELDGQPDYNSLLYYQRVVENQIQGETEGRICVIESKRLETARFFVAAYIAIEKVRAELLVDVYGAVLAVQSKESISHFSLQQVTVASQ